MKRYILSACVAVLVVSMGNGLFAQSAKETPKSAPAPTAPKADTKPAATPENPEGSLDPRSKALELAGAFTNDGFKIRDGYFKGVLEPNKPVLFEVNLYAGDQYWFCAGMTPADQPARKIGVAIYDETGKKIDAELYKEDNTGAAGIVAGNSGRYYVEVTLESGPKADYCFLYAYK
ncbi:MAG: hypothetical protein ABIP97_08840 [Chthoniobacterales bacterium]